MSDKQTQNKMMQEAIDGQLSEDMTEQLFSILDRDKEAAQEFNRLQTMDSLFKRAPHKRAPARLAATIMARLAERIEAETKLENLPQSAQQAVMLGMSVTILSMMPMMEAAAWLVLNAKRDPKLLSEVMTQTVGLMSIITDAMVMLMEEAENMARENPETATATLALTPYVMIELLDYVEDMLDRMADS